MPEPTSLSDADERVLRHLSGTGVDYPALVAANTGLHIPLVERRLATMEERGFVEAATGERIYRITDAGTAALSDGSPTATEERVVEESPTAADGGEPIDLE
ncbi:DUF2250 domain-containing protein [Halobaculum sp. CBA1158]|uniref:DUF2250 domain-containing protein n=1 Tax=Halobaculum sp. CBA1158 TaxID=2904243 RepID=UPI001F48C98E|nr:DUF2250 domain-containing protein [Halobaculum sp. CBA1158]UIO99591.1 DUF2250 domain-containing protein [Halobaculum sp. CBA1158]